jgi:hypothetical protein
MLTGISILNFLSFVSAFRNTSRNEDLESFVLGFLLQGINATELLAGVSTDNLG